MKLPLLVTSNSSLKKQHCLSLFPKLQERRKKTESDNTAYLYLMKTRLLDVDLR